MRQNAALVDGVGIVVRRLRAGQQEIEDAIFTLREMSRAQAALLDQLVIGVTREHVAELKRAGRSRDHQLLERVRILLASGCSDVDMVAGGVDLELDYDLDGEHVGVVAIGAECEVAMRGVAWRLGRRLLYVARERGIVWAWLGGRRILSVDELERACAAQGMGDVRFVLGEPARGLEGWRMTHRQAQAALLVARRKPQRVTRYGDVVLLAAVLGDEVLENRLLHHPPQNARGPACRSSRNSSSTAAKAPPPHTSRRALRRGPRVQPRVPPRANQEVQAQNRRRRRDIAPDR
jgi:hypothetical protein